MSTAKAPTHRHCQICGYPLSSQTCAACGTPNQPLILRDEPWRSKPPTAQDLGQPDLEWAFEAWNKQEYARFVTHCLSVVGVSNPRSVSVPKGQGFLAELMGQPVLISVSDGHVSLEAPVAQLPQTRRLGLMRMALEISHLDSHPARFSLRGSWLLARFTGLLIETDPQHFLWALRSLVDVARMVSQAAQVAFDARPILSDGGKFDWEAMPKPIALSKLTPPLAPASGNVAARGAPTSSSPGLFDSMPSLSEDGYPDESDDDEGGATLVKEPESFPVPGSGRAAAIPTSPTRRTATAGDPKSDSSISDTALTATPPPKRPPPRSARASDPGEVPPPPPSPPASSVAAKPPSIAAPSAIPKTTPTGVPPPPVSSNDPASRLCLMLAQAKKFAAQMDYEDSPATVMLLLRSTVYRAVFEHIDGAPHAVAHLFHGTSGTLREIWLTAPGRRRGAMQIPRPDTAYDVIDRVIASQGAFQSEPPIKIMPLTSARDAKEHLARYVTEIEQAPSDLRLRHFLSLGALCELLVRTKLPAPTQQKLRSIVTHSLREGAKPGSVELMMTALKRIIG